MFFMVIKTRGVIMDKKKIITMLMTVGLGTMTVSGTGMKNIVSATNDTDAVQKMGDVNNDGIIDSLDATNILMEYTGISTDGKSVLNDSQKKSADTNNDGLIDSVDASCVLVYYAYSSTGGVLSMEQWRNEIRGTETTVTTVSIATTTTNTQTTTTVTTETTATSTVTSPKISEIRLTRYDIDIPVGGKDISYVTMLPDSVENKDEIWTTSDEKIAVVDKWGYITGISEGICTVTVKSADNPSVKAEIKVTVHKDTEKIQEIKLSKYEMNLPVGGKDISYVTMLPDSVENKDEIWATSDEKIATVDKWGNVTGVSAGNCIITVTSVSNPEIKADIKVTVKAEDNKINKISLSKYEMNLLVGDKDISYVTMLPDSVENKNEIWTTSDEKIATVDKWGNITGVSAGTCTITVTSADNPEVKADIKVNVTENSQSNFQQINGLTYIDGILIANKSYSLPSTYDPGMDATTIKQFGLLSNSASKEGLNIYLSSGYRSYSYQQGIYNNYVSWYGKATADTFSARAGHSEHQTGLAIDVNSIDDSFAGTPEAIWLENHAHEFGFIIRYPKGKENITGYKYEPWHIRYLGVEKATDVYNSGLTLEEYLGIDSYYH